MIDSNQHQLLPGERVLWEGRPAAGFALRAIETLLIPFSLLWGGFAVFWNYGVWNSDAPIFFRLWGLPFLVAGFYIVAGRWFLDAYLWRCTRYVITSKRILILRNGLLSKRISLEIGNLPTLELEEKQPGIGTIRFGARSGWSGGLNMHIWQSSLDPTPQFHRIDNVLTVYQIIDRQRGG